MTKLFGVNKVKAQAPSETHQIRHITHEGHEETHEEVEEKYEEVEEMDESSHGVHDVDIGQIAVDVLDLSDEIIIVAPIAGVDPSDIDIALSRNILTLSGERKTPSIYMDAKRMLVEECFFGSFSRSIILPENLAFNKIRATVEENVIMVHIPKLSFFSKTIKVEK
ncbi:Hsp20/alpha crystallin family protein [Candidatus Gracilibacteria bacterium]|nr:Hsp20/alpha crystallin family protein [Candidatus Gracilibacteria bacterium]